MIVRVSNEHNHDNDLVEEAVRNIVEEKVAAAAENPTFSPRSAFMDITKNVLNAPRTSSGIPYLPKMKSVARRIARMKKDNLDAPPIPKKWDDMVLPDSFKTTNDNLEFCIMDHTMPEQGQRSGGFHPLLV